MISYSIIFFYAFNVCCLTNIYTKLYLEYYFRLLYNVYNMEVVHIKKINYFIFLLVPHDKFLVPPLLTPGKNPRATTYLGMDRENYYSGRSWYECIVLKDDMLSTLLEIGIPPSPTTKEKDVTLRHVNFTFSHLFWFFFLFIKPSFFF